MRKKKDSHLRVFYFSGKVQFLFFCVGEELR